MVEYILDTILATSGTDAEVVASIKDEFFEPITKDCSLRLHIGEDMITIAGDYIDNLWLFVIPAEVTKDLKGRYFYCIAHNNEMLCDKEPIYFR